MTKKKLRALASKGNGARILTAKVLAFGAPLSMRLGEIHGTLLAIRIALGMNKRLGRALRVAAVPIWDAKRTAGEIDSVNKTIPITVVRDVAMHAQRLGDVADLLDLLVYALNENDTNDNAVDDYDELIDRDADENDDSAIAHASYPLEALARLIRGAALDLAALERALRNAPRAPVAEPAIASSGLN